MKQFNFNLGAGFLSDVMRPIRSKADALSVLMRCTKLMLIGDLLPEEEKAGEMVLLINKRSRIYVFGDEKFFSLAFPFFVHENEGSLNFSTVSLPDVDSKVTSAVIAGLTLMTEKNGVDVYDFVESFHDIVDPRSEFWTFFTNLLMLEDGYIRYDYDPVNSDGDIHPLNHYDIFYSSAVSCKVGLRERIESDRMLDFLSPESACHFLET